MGKRRIVLGITALGLLAAGAWPVRVLEVTLPREDHRIIAMMPVRIADPILLQYRHSVELTRVEGVFHIAPGSGLTAVETRFESAGTGLPNHDPARTTRRGQWWVVDEGRRPLAALRFFIVPINRARLQVAGRPIPVPESDGGTLVQLKSFSTARLVWLIQSTAAGAVDRSD